MDDSPQGKEIMRDVLTFDIDKETGTPSWLEIGTLYLLISSVSIQWNNMKL